MGGDATRLLEEVHLSPGVLTALDGIVPLRPAMRFAELATREVGPVMASLAVPQQLTELGSFGRYLLGASSLHQALTRLVRGARTLATGMQLELRPHPGSIWLCRTTTSNPAHDEHLLDPLERYVLELVLLLVRHWLGEGWWPQELWLQGEPWLDDARFSAIPRLRYRAPSFALEISLEETEGLTGEPPPPDEPASVDVTPLDELDFVGSLQRVIETQLPLGRTSLPEIAALIGTSGRTLQRRLDAQRITYSELLDEVRLRLAVPRLQHTQDTVTAIARDLGYSDSAHFARAFRRWMGVSPLSLRLPPAAGSGCPQQS